MVILGNLVEWFLAPIMVGLVVLLGQYWLQPKITEKEQIKTQKIQEKKEVYIEAAILINQLWSSINWSGKSGGGVEPIPERVNNCAARLLLVSETKEVPVAFLSLFQKSTVNNALKSEDRIAFLNLLRKDMYGSEISDLDLMTELPLLIKPKEK